MHLLKSIDEVAYQALHEDLGDGDLTANLLPEDAQIKARLITREDAVLCGTCWFDSVFNQLDKNIDIQWRVKDGDDIVVDQELCILEGPARAILTGERTAMNGRVRLRFDLVCSSIPERNVFLISDQARRCPIAFL